MKDNFITIPTTRVRRNPNTPSTSSKISKLLSMK
jgi:hypothetical protein